MEKIKWTDMLTNEKVLRRMWENTSILHTITNTTKKK